MSPAAVMARRTENSSKPVAKLPDEILYQIFQQYKALCRACGERFLRWSRVARVCHAWREVALGSTYLWNEVPLHNLKRVQELLVRSGTSPLIVSSSMRPRQETADYHRAVELVCKELSRVRELQLVLPPSLFRIFLEARMTASAVDLIYFDLTVGGYVDEIAASELLGSVGTPHLRHFAFSSHGGISWESLAARLPSTLQELSITHSNRIPRRITEILAVLKGLPSLKSLHLEGVLPTATRDRPLPPLTLSSLTFISLCGTPVRCAAFLRHVRFPGVRTMQLKSVVTSPTALDELAPILTDRICDGGSPKEFVNFNYDELANAYETRIHAWTATENVTRLTPGTVRQFRVILIHEKYGTTLPAFVHALPLASIKTLYVSPGSRENSVVRYEDEQANWRTTFGNMTAVEMLHLNSRRKHVLPFVFADEQYPPHEYMQLAKVCFRKGQAAKEDMKVKMALRMLSNFFPSLKRLVVKGVPMDFSRINMDF